MGPVERESAFYENVIVPHAKEGKPEEWTCRPWAGLWSAFKIRVRLLDNDKSVAEAIQGRLLKGAMEPATLRWFSKSQLKEVEKGITNIDPTQLEKIELVFEKAIYIDYTKNKNVEKRNALIHILEPIYEKIKLSFPPRAPSFTPIRPQTAGTPLPQVDASFTTDAVFGKTTKLVPDTAAAEITSKSKNQAKNTLTELNATLGDRAAGTYVLCESAGGTKCHLFILRKGGKIDTLDFTYDKVAQKLSKDGKQYELGTLLQALGKEQREKALLASVNKALFTDRQVDGKTFRQIAVVKDGQIISQEWEMQKIGDTISFVRNGQVREGLQAHYDIAKELCGAKVSPLEDSEIEKSTWVRLHSIESRQHQIETMQMLRALMVDIPFATPQDQRSLFERFTVDQNSPLSPFVILPAPAESGADFRIAAHFLTDNRLAWNSPVTILENGMIKHGGRTYQNFDALKAQWKLGTAIYDAFAASESSYHTEDQVQTALKQCSEDCFLLWSDGKQHVSVRTGDAITTYDLAKDKSGRFTLIHKGTATPIEGELIHSLTSKFKKPYGDLEALQPFQQLMDAPDAPEKPINQRVKNLAGTGFTLKQDPNHPRRLIVTEFTPGSWLPLAREKTETYSVTLLADGKVLRIQAGQEPKIFDSFEDIKSKKTSIKQLEEQTEVNAAKQAKIDAVITKLLTQSEPNKADNRAAARQKIQEYSQTLLCCTRDLLQHRFLFHNG